MKISISTSAVLTAVVIAPLIAAMPFAVMEFFERGELYLLSQRFIDDMVARLHGPARLRFILQPMAAMILGVRDGVKDARASDPPLWGLILHPGRRLGLVRSALVSIRDLLAMAILLDLAVQFLIFRVVHPGAALVLGPLLIALPYASSRVLSNRVARWQRKRARITESHRGIRNPC